MVDVFVANAVLNMLLVPALWIMRARSVGTPWLSLIALAPFGIVAVLADIAYGKWWSDPPSAEI